ADGGLRGGAWGRPAGPARGSAHRDGARDGDAADGAAHVDGGGFGTGVHIDRDVEVDRALARPTVGLPLQRAAVAAVEGDALLGDAHEEVRRDVGGAAEREPGAVLRRGPAA